jgi:hypothetical protein
VPWSRYIDQLGNARGGTVPFPIDPRAATAAKVAGRFFERPKAPPKQLAEPAPKPKRDGYAPYGKVIELEQIQERAA